MEIKMIDWRLRNRIKYRRLITATKTEILKWMKHKKEKVATVCTSGTWSSKKKKRAKRCNDVESHIDCKPNQKHTINDFEFLLSQCVYSIHIAHGAIIILLRSFFIEHYFKVNLWLCLLRLFDKLDYYYCDVCMCSHWSACVPCAERSKRRKVQVKRGCCTAVCDILQSSHNTKYECVSFSLCLARSVFINNNVIKIAVFGVKSIKVTRKRFRSF